MTEAERSVLISGDITRLDVDAIVNAANPTRSGAEVYQRALEGPTPE